eukprot:11748663-Heterocapsa_arctica.AAC.1
MVETRKVLRRTKRKKALKRHKNTGTLLEIIRKIKELQQAKKRGTGDNEDEELPGGSNQKRVKIKAEQLFIEAQAFKKTQIDSTEQKRTREADKDDKGKL